MNLYVALTQKTKKRKKPSMQKYASIFDSCDKNSSRLREMQLVEVLGLATTANESLCCSHTQLKEKL